MWGRARCALLSAGCVRAPRGTGARAAGFWHSASPGCAPFRPRLPCSRLLPQVWGRWQGLGRGFPRIPGELDTPQTIPQQADLRSGVRPLDPRGSGCSSSSPGKLWPLCCPSPGDGWAEPSPTFPFGPGRCSTRRESPPCPPPSCPASHGGLSLASWPNSVIFPLGWLKPV